MSCCGRVRCTPGATHATGRLINKTTGPLSRLRAVGPEGTHERTRARSSNCTTAGRDSRPLPRGCVLSSEGGGAAQSWVSSS
jgi:hypothetical protein